MTAYTACLIALLTGAMLPAVIMASRGRPIDRLVGLEFVGAIATFVLIMFSQVAQGQSFDLVLPLVLAPLSFAGILVFTRLLAQRGDP